VSQGNRRCGEVTGWYGGLSQQLCIFLLRLKNDQAMLKGTVFSAFHFSAKGQEVNLAL